jgi:hypothetical protein
MWFVVVVDVYWALALAELFEGLHGMLFVMGMCCVWGVIVWLVVR